jgi:nucleoside-diphosphate-sugar epimerase
MTKVLITGANSFVGTNFRKFSHFEVIDEVSLQDRRLEEIEFEKYDIVLHLAAIGHQSKKIENEKYFLVNRDLTVMVAKQAKREGVRQFVFLSTVKVYGKFIPGSEPWKEDSDCHPYDAYGKSKYEAELALKELEDKDFIVSIIRTPIVYGDEVKANMLKFIKLIERFPVLPFRDVENTQYYTFVENLVDYIDRVIELKAPGIFIAMDDNALSTSDLALTIAKLLHKKPFIFRLPNFIVRTGVFLYPRLFERLYGSIRIDNNQTKKVLTFTPRYSTEEGLKRTVLSLFKTENQIHN